MIDWHFIFAEVRRRIGDRAFEIWVDPARPIGFESETLTIAVRDGNHQKVLKRDFEQVILTVLREQGFPAQYVEYVRQKEASGSVLSARTC